MNKVSLFIVAAVLSGCSSFKKLEKNIVKPSLQKEAFKAYWGKNLDPAYLSGNLPIHLNGAIVHDEHIFVGSANNGFMALKELNGRELWRSNEKEFYTSLPVVYEGAVIYGTESGRIFSRNILNGELNYEIEVGASVDGNPVVDGGRLFVQLRNHQVFAIDAVTGKTLWSYKKSVTNKTSIQKVGQAYVDGSYVFFGFADGDMVSFRVETGEIVWEKKVGQLNDKFLDLDRPILHYKNRLVTVDSAGNIFFINKKSGEVEEQIESSASTNLIIQNDEIIFGDSWGRINRVRQDYSIENLGQVSKRALSRVALWRGGVVISDISGMINFFSLSDYKILQTKNLGNELSTLFTAPVKGKLGGLLVFTNRGRLYYYR